MACVVGFHQQMAVRRSLSSSLVVLGVMLATFAGCLAPTNPYDPNAPVAAQAKGRIIGRVLLPTDVAEITLHLEDTTGARVANASGELIAIVTRESPPTGLPDGNGLPFEVADLTPGSYRLTFDALENEQPLLADAASETLTVSAGATVVRNVTVEARDLNAVAGAVAGVVAGEDNTGIGTLVVRLAAMSGNTALNQTLVMNGVGAFEFRNVVAGEYSVTLAGDGVVPAASARFVVGEARVSLSEPLLATTLGRVFALDDFRSDEGLPPFAPFVRASPVHVAVSPLVFPADVSAFVRTWTEAPSDEDWQPVVGGGDTFAQVFDDGADGEKHVFAQLRLCFSGCDNALAPPMLSAAFDLPFVLDTVPPRATAVSVGGSSETTVAVACADFGDIDCAAAIEDAATLPILADVVDDGSRVLGTAVTLDDEAEPLSFDAVVGGASARVATLSPAIARASNAEHTLRLWAIDVAGNVGLASATTLRVDTEPPLLALPPIVAMAGVGTKAGRSVVSGSRVILVPGQADALVAWRLRSSGTAQVSGLPSVFVPMTDPVVLDVVGSDGDTLQLDVSARDEVGNAVDVPAALSIPLARTATLHAHVEVDGQRDAANTTASLSDANGDVLVVIEAGTDQLLVDVNGTPLLASFSLDGALQFDAVPVPLAAFQERRQYAIDVEGAAPLAAAHADITLAPLDVLDAGELRLQLPRGGLRGRFVLEDRASTANAGISVSVLDANGAVIAATATLASGDFVLSDVPVALNYTIVPFFPGYLSSSIESGLVLEQQDTLLQTVTLSPLAGDFALCAPSAAIEAACEGLAFTNRNEVQVGNVSVNNVIEHRVATSSFAAGDLSPPFVSVTQLPRVPLVDEGVVRIFYQQRLQSGESGPVLEATVVHDTVAPANARVVVERAADALRDGITNGRVAGAPSGLHVAIVASAEAGAGDVAPLAAAHVTMAATAPLTLTGVRCNHGATCTIPFEDGAERLHSVFATSCDAAGNCAAPVESQVLLDVTPPRAVHGVAFRPIGADVVEGTPGRYFSRSALFQIDVDVGTARNAAGAVMTDASGTPLADVWATQFGLNALVDDGTLTAIAAPSVSAGSTRTVSGLAIPAVDGDYEVFARFVDAAGNASIVEPNVFSFALRLDSIGPRVQFALQDTDSADADVTNDAEVRLVVNDVAADPAIRARFNTTGLFDDDVPSSFVEHILPLVSDAFALPTAPGRYTVFGQFFDAAGNLTERSATITLDDAPPVVASVSCVSCQTFDGALFSSDPDQVVLNGIAFDDVSSIDHIAVTVDFAGGSEEMVFEPNTTLLVPLATQVAGQRHDEDGTYNVDVVFVDVAGNASAITTLRIVKDTTIPAARLSIAADAAFTQTANVAVAIGDAADAVSMRIANGAAVFVGAAQPFSPQLAWVLENPASDERKRVFVELRDAAGNTAVISDDIVLDTRAPVGTVQISGGSRINTTTASVVLAYDVADAVAHAITTTEPGFASDCSDAVFVSSSPPATTQVTFAATTSGEPEDRSVWVCTRDGAGNTALATDAVVLDEDQPTGTVVLNGGSGFSTTRTLTATIAAPSDTSEMAVALTGPTTSPTALDCASQSYAASASSLSLNIPPSSAAGLYTLQVCLKDASGNIAASAIIDQIVFDAAAPTVSLTLNRGDAFTTQASVTAQISASDDLAGALGGIVGMRIANTTPTFTGALESLVSERGTTLAAPTTEESKTVCVEVTDAAGRTANACDSITLDLTPPVGTVTIARAVANFSTDGDGVLSTTFRSTDTGIASVAFGQAPIDCSSVAASNYVALLPNTNLVADVAVASGEGTRSVTGCFKAQSGLISAVTDTVFVDPENPPLATPVSPVSGAILSTKRPVFSWSSVSGASSYTLIVRDFASPNTTRLSQAGIVATSFTPSTDLPERALQWIVVANKASGRASAAVFDAASTVTLDDTDPNVAPSGLAVAVHAGFSRITSPSPCAVAKPCINDPFATLSFTLGADVADSSVVHVVEVALNGDFSSPLFTGTRTDGGPFDVPVFSDGTYRWRVRVVDDAGNAATSATSDFIVDRTAPLAPTIFPPPDPVSEDVVSGLSIVWSNESSSGASQYLFELATDSTGFGSPILSRTQAANTLDLMSPSLGISLTDGANVRHILRVASLDALGNRSNFAFSTFIHDDVAPCTTSSSAEIQGTNTDNTFSSSHVVTVAVSCIGDNPSLMQIGCNRAAEGMPFVPFANVTTCVFPNSDGVRSVAVNILDNAGNSRRVTGDAITVDRRAPTAPVLATDDVVTNDDTFEVEIEQASIDANFDHHEFMNGVDVVEFIPVLENTAPIRFPVFGAAPENRTYAVRVRGVDQAGNASAESLVRVTYDDVPPTRPSIFGEGDTQFVNAPSFTFNLATASSDTNFATYETASCTADGCVVDDADFVENPGNGTFTFLLVQDRPNRFFVRGRDRAGNRSDAAELTVVEDSRNPRPISLEPLPAAILSGAALSVPGVIRGGYVDVFLSRDENEFSILSGQIDDNFDHFEIRATAPSFAAFVPVCSEPTALCTIPFRSDTGELIDQTTIPILRTAFGVTTMVGFRVPIARSVDNTITLRSVDKAGNISLETSVTTRDITDQRVTADAGAERNAVVFGDKVAFIDEQSPTHVVVKEIGVDNLWSTDDDDRTVLANAEVNTSTGHPSAIAVGPNVVVFVQGSDLFAVTGGADGRFATTGDNVVRGPLNDDGGGAAVNEANVVSEPSLWQGRLVWRELVSSSDSDIVLRSAGANNVLGDGDDTFARIADDTTHQLFPSVSGEHVAFLTCSDANAFGCGPGQATVLGLTVHRSGNDRIFGSGDDVTTVLTQAVDVAYTRPVLFTPSNNGRAACQNVLAYGGNAPHKGVWLVGLGANFTFETTDVPVQVMSAKSFGSGSVFNVVANGDFVAASDGFAPPFTEIVWAGRDGCLTRTNDNVAFDSNVVGQPVSLNSNLLLLSVFDPTNDVALLEIGAERPVWMRNDTGMSFFPNGDLDVNGIAFGSGSVYDFSSRTLSTLFVGEFEGGFSQQRWATAPSIGGLSDQLHVRNSGDDGRFGTDDDSTAQLTSRRVFSNNNYAANHGIALGLFEDTLAFAGGGSGGKVVPIVRHAGADGVFADGGDDCEVAVGVPEADGYQDVAVTRQAMVFARCGSADCSSTDAVLVREVSNGNQCRGGETLLRVDSDVQPGLSAQIDGRRVVWVNPGVNVLDAGPDRRFSATADNVSTSFFLPSGTSMASFATAIAGDRVYFVDSRSGLNRVVIGDLADMSTRTLTRTATADSGVSASGAGAHYHVDTDNFFAPTSSRYVFGPEADEPGERTQLPPSQLLCPSDDVFEENDSRLTAQPVNNGAVWNGILCSRDSDRFAIDVVSGCTIRAAVSFLSSEGNLDLALFDPSDAVVAVASSSSANVETVTAVASQSGTYVIGVAGASATDSNTYDASVSVTCP